MSEQAKLTDREITIQRAVAAGRIAGQAEAMKHNLTLVGSDKSTFWFEESQIWVKRRDEIVNSLPDGNVAVRELALEAMQDAFAQDKLGDLSRLQPEESIILMEISDAQTQPLKKAA